MRISDWSSDVCSSDLEANVALQPGLPAGAEKAVDGRRRKGRLGRRPFVPQRQQSSSETAIFFRQGVGHLRGAALCKPQRRSAPRPERRTEPCTVSREKSPAPCRSARQQRPRSEEQKAEL